MSRHSRSFTTMFTASKLRRCGISFSLSVIGLFLTTSLILHAHLQVVDDEDVPLVQFGRGGRATSGMKAMRDAVLRGGKARHSLRRVFEAQHPLDLNRTRAVVQALRKPDPKTQPDVEYDLYNCPDEPPEGYPHTWRLYNVSQNWNVDDTDVPPQIHQGLCVFDWETDEQTMETYRQAEKPFILRNHPEIYQTVERWSQPDYIRKLFGNRPQRTEHALTNHLMYWTDGIPHKPEGWKPPSENIKMTYSEWLEKAEAIEKSDVNQAEQEHWYYRINAREGENEQLYEELPVFQPVQSTFIVDIHDTRGINCRAGMKGNMAEAHYDQSRNWILLLTGMRRYILAHPDQCENLELYPKDHPSLRHTSVDWSHMPNRDPIASAQVNEVVLQAGDALYLPTSWFHHIISLTTNVQCNARSGMTNENMDIVNKCMHMWQQKPGGH